MRFIFLSADQVLDIYVYNQTWSKEPTFALFQLVSVCLYMPSATLLPSRDLRASQLKNTWFRFFKLIWLRVLCPFAGATPVFSYLYPLFQTFSQLIWFQGPMHCQSTHENSFFSADLVPGPHALPVDWRELFLFSWSGSRARCVASRLTKIVFLFSWSGSRARCVVCRRTTNCCWRAARTDSSSPLRQWRRNISPISPVRRTTRWGAAPPPCLYQVRT